MAGKFFEGRKALLKNLFPEYDDAAWGDGSFAKAEPRL